MYEAFGKAAAPIFCTVDGMCISYISDWPAQEAKPFEVPTVLNAPGPIVLNPYGRLITLMEVLLNASPPIPLSLA